MINGIHHACFTVSNIERSIAFYRDILGMKVLWDSVEAGVIYRGEVSDKITGCPGTEQHLVYLGIGENFLELVEYMGQKEQVHALIAASKGFDQPAFEAFFDAPTYAEIGPPKGTLYNYTARGDEVTIAAGWPAPPQIATLIFSKNTIPVMCAKAIAGELKPKDAITWAAGQLEDYKAETGM